MSEPNYDADMQLPEGRSCADCRHIARCSGFGFSWPERTMCDFWPSRYWPKRFTDGEELGPSPTSATVTPLGEDESLKG